MNVSAERRTQNLVQFLILCFEPVIDRSLIPDFLLNVRYLRLNVFFHFFLQFIFPSGSHHATQGSFLLILSFFETIDIQLVLLNHFLLPFKFMQKIVVGRLHFLADSFQFLGSHF